MVRQLIVVLVLTVAPHLAEAGDRAKAEQYFNAGSQAFRQQSFGAAAEQFELAYKELPLPEIAFSAAQAYRRQYYIDAKPEYVKRAVELYQIYLGVVKSGGRVGDASDGVAEMKHELDRLTTSGTKVGDVRHDATTRIAVSVSVAGETQSALTEISVMPATSSTGAKATLDGQPMELFNPIEVAPGPHTVAVTADGYLPFTETRQVIPGATDLVPVKLVPRPAHVTITTEDGAQVAINGRPVGEAPIPPQDLPPGSYFVTVTRRGREPIERQITVARAETRALALPMTVTGRRKFVPRLLVGAGVLALGAATTTILAFHYDSTMSSLDHQRTTTGITTDQLASYRNAARDRDDYRDTALVLGGLAIVAGGVAAALYYFDVPTVGEHLVVPTAIAGGGGAALIGRF